MTHIKILGHYLNLAFLVLGVVEFCLAAAAAVVASYWIIGEHVLIGYYWGSLQFWQAIVFASVMTGTTISMGVYGSAMREGYSGTAIRSLASFCLLGGVALSAIYYLFPFMYLGQDVLVAAIVVALGLVLVFRALFFLVFDTRAMRNRILVYGAGEGSANLLKVMQDLGAAGLAVKGFFALEGQDIKVPQDQVLELPPRGLWLDLINELGVSEIVITEDLAVGSEGFPADDLLDCKLAGVRVTRAIDFYERQWGRIELNHLHMGWLLFSSGFGISHFRDAAKRTFDIVASLLLIALTWPLMMCTALAVFLETGRPIVYSQTRVGRNGAVFTLHKFRSMTVDAESDGQAVWATKNDNRVTTVGKFIRNTRLDELPQLYCVLKGDMSFVGPRPERPEFVEQLNREIPFYEARSRVKPGLMGWAQLKYAYGASVEDAAQKLRYDLYYVKNHSFMLDLLIVVQTVEVILLGKGVR